MCERERQLQSAGLARAAKSRLASTPLPWSSSHWYSSGLGLWNFSVDILPIHSLHQCHAHRTATLQQRQRHTSEIWAQATVSPVLLSSPLSHSCVSAGQWQCVHWGTSPLGCRVRCRHGPVGQSRESGVKGFKQYEATHKTHTRQWNGNDHQEHVAILTHTY